jgi:hypothetical protein
MQRKHRTLLLVDAVVNLLLGVLLLLAPVGTLQLLGLPSTETYFYAVILGAVIVGIGVALLVELLGAPARTRGLGLGGAIAINVCGGLALLGWVIVNPFELPLRGTVVLWVVAAVVLGVAIAELAARSWRYED